MPRIPRPSPTGSLAAAVVGALALTALQWIRYDATVFDEARRWWRGEITARQFYEAGRDCDRCSAAWLSLPVLIIWGPLAWLAANGGYLLLSEHAPTLAPIDDDPSPPLSPNHPTMLDDATRRSYESQGITPPGVYPINGPTGLNPERGA